MGGKLVRVVVADDDPEVVITIYERGALMKADYDSEADAVQIELAQVDHWDGEVMIDERELCGVALVNNKPVAVSLRYPREELRLLEIAAERFDLSGMALRATTQAALAAPDHVVTVDVDPRVLVDSEAPSRAA